MLRVVTSTMTLQEAADQLGTHYMTVYRYVRLGRLPARKVGGTWEVEKADVEALQTGGEQKVRPRHSADWSARLEARLVEGDEAGAEAVEAPPAETADAGPRPAAAEASGESPAAPADDDDGGRDAPDELTTPATGPTRGCSSAR